MDDGNLPPEIFEKNISVLFDIFAGVRIVYWEIWVKGAIKSESVKSVYPLSEAYPHRAEEENHPRAGRLLELPA